MIYELTVNMLGENFIMAKSIVKEELFEIYESKLQKCIATESVTNISDEIISKTKEIVIMLILLWNIQYSCFYLCI